MVSFLLRTDLRKLPDPQAGSRKRESMRSDSILTKSSMSSTIQLGVKTSPWSATRCLDFTKSSGSFEGGSVMEIVFRASLSLAMNQSCHMGVLVVAGLGVTASNSKCGHMNFSPTLPMAFPETKPAPLK